MERLGAAGRAAGREIPCSRLREGTRIAFTTRYPTSYRRVVESPAGGRRMTPREFLDQVVRPNVADFHANYGSLRHGYNAVAVVDALAAHIFWYIRNAPAQGDDTAYRATLASRNHDFRLLRDIAKAQKHVRLTKGVPQVVRAEQVSARSISYGEGQYGAGRYDGPPQLVVDINPGDFRYVESVVDAALTFLEGEMQRLGI